MSGGGKRTERLDLVGAFEQGWIQYRANFLKIVPYGFLATVPSIFFLWNIAAGVIAALLLQGVFFIMLANVVFCSVNGTKNDIYSVSHLWNMLKNGIVLSIFLLPLLAVSFVLLIVPSVIIFSLFIFSFFIVAAKEKFAVDALMDSLRTGFGYRLHLFLFSLIFYSSVIISAIVSSYIPFIFILINGLTLPYFFAVINELYEQLEKK
jgi:hypothetical protein